MVIVEEQDPAGGGRVGAPAVVDFVRQPKQHTVRVGADVIHQVAGQRMRP